MGLRDGLAWRLHTIFVRKIMVLYCDIFKGELALLQTIVLEELSMGTRDCVSRGWPGNSSCRSSTFRRSFPASESLASWNLRAIRKMAEATL